MLQLTHHPVETYAQQKWKNGKGATREIAIDSSTPYRWRVSWAQVGAGPSEFSAYPGYDRILVLLKGGPVTLVHGEKKPRSLSMLSAYPFKGDWDTRAAVVTPAEDFNLFLLSGSAKGGVYPTFLNQSEEVQFPLAAQEHFIFCVDGMLTVTDPNQGKSFPLSPGEIVRASRSSPKEFLNLKAHGSAERSRCLWVTVHLL